MLVLVIVLLAACELLVNRYGYYNMRECARMAGKRKDFAMQKSRLMLITNPGSSSRKYALYKGDNLVASLHFEFEDGGIICTLKDGEDRKYPVELDIDRLDDAVGEIRGILERAELLSADAEIDAIIVRTVAPGDYFTKDRLIDKAFLERLEEAQSNAPLHLPVVVKEIKHFMDGFPETKIVSVSDTSFHTTKPDVNQYYAIDKELADRYGIKRFGYHGLSVGSVANFMEENGIMKEKVVVCHVGSGSSVSALLNGKSFNNSMGYSPLEGVMMATRCGNIDASAVLAIKRNLGLDDMGVERYLNKETGLKGASGFSDDMREVEQARDAGNERASFALELYAQRIVGQIGRMAAEMGGVDALVFTATIGERGEGFRAEVLSYLGHLGFEVDEAANDGKVGEGYKLISKEDSKPVWVIKTNEFGQMVRQANGVLDLM